MTLALFDLDNTLINGDSDYQWGRFLARQGVVDGAFYERENQRFYDEYKAGKLDIREFLRFSLKPLADNPRCHLNELRDQFMQEEVEPLVQAAALDLVRQHAERGDTLVIITATNHFVTELIARRYDIEHLIATMPESDASGEFTGEVQGTPCFQVGKISRLKEWLEGRDETLEGSWFYSDSQNDIPLLETVEHPVAVDPDDTLRTYAENKGWKVISLRD